MNKPFIDKTLLINYIFIGSFIFLVIFANIYFQTTKTLWLAVVLLVALIIKVRKIKARKQKLDEREEYITFRALSTGFFFITLAVLWFYTKEMTLEGQISTRTAVELASGFVGYLGSYFYLRKIF